jgi:hypothetical protein
MSNWVFNFQEDKHNKKFVRKFTPDGRPLQYLGEQDGVNFYQILTPEKNRKLQTGLRGLIASMLKSWKEVPAGTSETDQRKATDRLKPHRKFQTR